MSHKFKLLTILGIIGLLLLTPNLAQATVQVANYMTHAPVVVCQPSDSNANCAPSGSATNVGIGTSGKHLVYTGTNTAGPSASMNEVAGNIGIGTTIPQGGFVVMNGNVGIGTWIPAAPLEVHSDGDSMRVGTGTNTATRIGFAWGGSSYRGSFGYDGTGMALTGGTAKAVSLYSNAASSPSLVLSSAGTNVGIGGTITDISTLAGADIFVNGTSGNIGIGTSVPGTVLDVNGVIRSSAGSAASPAIVGRTGGNTTGEWFPVANTLALSTNALERMRIDSGGNVGIGTVAPTSNVSIFGTGQDSGIDVTGAAVSGGIDSSTKLMLHMDGTNGSTTFTDSELAPTKTVTANGNAQISTAQSEFGGASGLFDGTGDYLTLADSADWAFGSAAVTIDGWIRKNAGGYYYVCSHRTDSSNQMQFSVNADGSASFTIKSAAVTFVSITAPAASFPNTTWVHFAIIRGWGGNVNSWALTAGGAQVGSTVTDATVYPDFTGLFHIGRNSGDTTQDFNGYIDEFRIEPGVAKWTTTFTPPNAAYFAAINQNRIRFNDGTTQTWNVTSDGNDSDKLKFSNGTVGTNDRLTLQKDGNLGIGTTSPVGGLAVMNGNVGIGTWIPSSPLSIKGSTVMQKLTGANTACSTTCGAFACFFGEDTGVLGTLLDCADATADVCFCSK